MDVLIKTHPQEDPVYQFIDKKRAQGKSYYVYMTAGANKFLRIYYGRVKEYLVFLSSRIKNTSVFILIDSASHTGVVLLCCEISIRKLEVKDIEWKLSWN